MIAVRCCLMYPTFEYDRDWQMFKKIKKYVKNLSKMVKNFLLLALPEKISDDA